MDDVNTKKGGNTAAFPFVTHTGNRFRAA